MTTKFDIGQKVYFDLPLTQWGWIQKITISKDHIVYSVLLPTGQIHQKVESSLRNGYQRESEERE